MTLSDSIFSFTGYSLLGTHLLDHLAADGAGFAGGQVAVVALLQVHADFAGRLHLKLVHSLPSLGNVDLVVALHTKLSPCVVFRKDQTLSGGKRPFLSASIAFPGMKKL